MFAGAGQCLALMIVLETLRLKAVLLHEDSKTNKYQASKIPPPQTSEKETICLA